MKYEDLYQALAKMPEESRKNLDVTVLAMDTDEVIPVMDFVTDWESEENWEGLGIDQVKGILDDGHPYLTIAL